MMMVATGRQERRRVSYPLRYLKPQNITVEPQCSLQIGHLQMDVSHPYARINHFLAHESLDVANIPLAP